VDSGEESGRGGGGRERRRGLWIDLRGVGVSGLWEKGYADIARGQAAVVQPAETKNVGLVVLRLFVGRCGPQ
jgi:hypothetical protein